MKIQKSAILDSIFILLILATPIMQWTFPWGIESKFSFKIFQYNLYFTEVFSIAIILTGILRKGIDNTKIIILLILTFGIFLSYLSGFGNQNPNWFSHFLISLDFFFYGVFYYLVLSWIKCYSF